MQEIKKREVEQCFFQTRQELTLFSQSQTVIESMKAYKKNFHSIKATDSIEKYNEKLKPYYLKAFRTNVSTGTNDTINSARLQWKN